MTHAQTIAWYRWPFVWLRQLYNWTLSWAYTPYGTPALGGLAFAEASFFPVPPDVLLMALALAKPQRAFFYAFVCTVGSVAGAVLGWLIGAGLWAGLGIYAGCPDLAGGAWLFEHVPSFTCENFSKVGAFYERHSWSALIMAAFTPLPFKVFTVAAGVFHLNLWVMLAASAVGRAARFFLVAGLIYRYGPPVRGFIERRFEWLTLIFGALLLGGFALLKYV